jgi:hypothetical protein
MSANEPFGDLLKWKFNHLDSSFDKTKDAKKVFWMGQKEREQFSKEINNTHLTKRGGHR